MRFEINLASQPYQDVQKFLTRWGVAVVLLAVITIGVTYKATAALTDWRKTRTQAQLLQKQIAQREQVKADVEAFLNRPENRETRDRSRFLNQLIARKAFSWTEVFTDLERIVPAHLKVLSIRPHVNEQDKLMVRLRVSSPVREPAIELINRIEQNPHFSQAEIISEALVREAGGRNQDVEVWAFDISAMYIPGFARPHESKAAGKGDKEPQTPGGPAAAKAKAMPAAGTTPAVKKMGGPVKVSIKPKTASPAPVIPKPAPLAKPGTVKPAAPNPAAATKPSAAGMPPALARAIEARRAAAKATPAKEDQNGGH